MRIVARLFASYREAVGANELTLEVAPGSQAREIVDRLQDHYPQLRGLQEAMLAVNLEYVDRDYRLSEGDEVALIPPVSGGTTC